MVQNRLSIAAQLAAKLNTHGVTISANDSELILRGNLDWLTPKRLDIVRRHKDALLDLITPRREPPQVTITPEERIPSQDQKMDPSALPPRRLTVQFGNEELPFDIWDGQALSGRGIAIDTETHEIEGHTIPKLVLASVSDGTDHYVVPRDRIPDFLDLHQNRHFVAHNMPFDFWVLQACLDSPVLWEAADQGRLHCSQIMEQLIRLAQFDDSPRPHSLDNLAQRHLKVELFGKDDPRRTRYSEIDGLPLDTVDPWRLQYAVQDAIAAIRVFLKQRTTAEKLQPSKEKLLPDANKRFGLLSETLQVRGAIALDWVSRNGMHLDRDKAFQARDSLRDELFDLAEELEKIEPGAVYRYKAERYITKENRGFKLTSSGYPALGQDAVRDRLAQVAAEHGLSPPVSDKEGKITLSRDFWNDHRELDPIIDIYLDIQNKGKLLGFFNQLNSNHIHPRYVPIVRSGRVSCRDPNIQQMPRMGNVREMFIPSPGHVLFAIDFAALELRTLAAVCLHKYGDSKLAEIINSGRDPHAYSYCQIQGITEEEFAAWKKEDPAAAKAARDKIKGLTFGIPGSMQPPGLVQYVKKTYGQTITLEEARQWRELLITKVYPEWRRYLSQYGNWVNTLTGRVRGKVQRPGQLFNTQFQGLAGDGAKLCLWRLMRNGYTVVGFIHDEFLIELPLAEDYSEPAADINRICCETMEEFTPGVKIACEYSVATCWSKAAQKVHQDGKLLAWSPEPSPSPSNVSQVQSDRQVVSRLEPEVAQNKGRAESTQPPTRPQVRKSVKIPLRWHGGKGADNGKLAKWIIGQMPQHIHYVEPFFGGGSVLFFKNPEGVSELANDVHGELINFYQVLRDPEQFRELQRLVGLTPMNGAEFELAVQCTDELLPIERARRFFVHNRQSRQGLMKDFITPVRSRVRRGMSDPVSAYLGVIDELDGIHQRLRRVQFTNMDALQLIRREDKPHVHIYCDPPYLHEARTATDAYAHEMTDAEHQQLLDVLSSCQHATWQLSGYHSNMYDAWASEHGYRWAELEIDNKASSRSRKQKMVECLWMNY